MKYSFWFKPTAALHPRFAFIAFKDTKNGDSILHDNSKFISFGAGNNDFIRSLQFFVANVRYPIDPIKFNDGTTNATRNIYPAFDLYEGMTHNFGNIASLDVHYFDNLATTSCFGLSASEELKKMVSMLSLLL